MIMIECDVLDCEFNEDGECFADYVHLLRSDVHLLRSERDEDLLECACMNKGGD